MHTNSYAGVVEEELSHLVVRRARRLRIGRDEIDDLQQQIVPKLAEFEFDPARSNGASRTTVMTAMIDRQIRAYLRAQRRYRQCIQRLHVLSGASAHSRPVWPRHVSQPEPVDLRMDLAAAMAGLSARDRAICLDLADGLAVKAIAGKLACGRDTVARAIVRIRNAFTAAGLRVWIDPDYRPGAAQA